jgi:hypothetical protein
MRVTGISRNFLLHARVYWWEVALNPSLIGLSVGVEPFVAGAVHAD